MTEEQNRAEIVERKPIPEEPELLALWRCLIEARDRIVSAVEGWEEFAESQRAGWRAIDEYPDERRAAVLEGRACGEQYLLGVVSQLRERLTRVDAEIKKGTRETDRDRDGFTIAGLKKCIALAELEAEREEEIARFLALHLRYKHKRNDAHATMNLKTVEELMRRNYGIESVDWSAIEQRGRELKKAKDNSGSLDDLARNMIKLARTLHLS